MTGLIQGEIIPPFCTETLLPIVHAHTDPPIRIALVLLPGEF